MLMLTAEPSESAFSLRPTPRAQKRLPLRFLRPKLCILWPAESWHQGMPPNRGSVQRHVASGNTKLQRPLRWMNTFFKELQHWTNRVNWVHLMLSTPCYKKLPLQGIDLRPQPKEQNLWACTPQRPDLKLLDLRPRIKYRHLRERISPYRDLPGEAVQKRH